MGRHTIEDDIHDAHKFRLLVKAVGILSRLFPGNRTLIALNALMKWVLRVDLSEMTGDNMIVELANVMYANVPAGKVIKQAKREMKQPCRNYSGQGEALQSALDVWTNHEINMLPEEKEHA